jgi:hypothetical protein
METIKDVKALANHQIMVCFSDNYTAIIDIKHILAEEFQVNYQTRTFSGKLR